MYLYKALVYDIFNKVDVVIECYGEKEDVMISLTERGYIVNPLKIVPEKLYDFISNYTEMTDSDWLIESGTVVLACYSLRTKIVYNGEGFDLIYKGEKYVSNAYYKDCVAYYIEIVRKDHVSRETLK